MHDVADNGVAAHWHYKEGGACGDAPSFRWVQDLLEILDNSAAPDEFLENTKLELYQDQVFCFTPKGQLIQLPRGATPVDFAYAVHSQVGDTCVGAKVNGRLLPLRHELQNGDQVEIMTARGGTPSPAWERFVVTGKARARIRRYVAQQQRQTHLDAGRAALAKAFRQEGLDGSEKVLEAALKALKRASWTTSTWPWAMATSAPRTWCTPPTRSCAEPRAPAHLPGLLGADHAAPGRATGRARSPAWSPAWPCTTPAAATRCRATASSASSPPARASPSTRRSCQTLESLAATPERFIDVDWDDAALAAGPTGKGGATHAGRISVIAANDPAHAGHADQCGGQAGGRGQQPAHRQPPAGLHRRCWSTSTCATCATCPR